MCRVYLLLGVGLGGLGIVSAGCSAGSDTGALGIAVPGKKCKADPECAAFSCLKGATCDTKSGTCAGGVTIGFCFVEQQCVPSGAVRKMLPCDRCDPATSQTSWSSIICPESQTCDPTSGTCQPAGRTGRGASNADDATGLDATPRAADAPGQTGVIGDGPTDAAAPIDAGYAVLACDPKTAAPGGFCAPCGGATDCLSGFCLDAPEGTVCSMTCLGECPSGWTCKVAATSPDVIQVCVPIAPDLGKPCIADQDCVETIGQTTVGDSEVCVALADGSAAFCASPCGPSSTDTSGFETCPKGFSCADTGGTGHRCLPDDPDAMCSARFVKRGAKTLCAVTNEAGTCNAERGCAKVGALAPCAATTPAGESCNGADDDCDGDTDEGFTWGGVALGKVCKGVGQCGAGVAQCAPGGKSATCSTNPNGSDSDAQAELCDGLDNDCNGETDDEFDVGAPCTSGSGNCETQGDKVCAQDGQGTVCNAPPPATDKAESCNGLDDDCDGLSDEGCDDDKDGYCDAKMLVFSGAPCGKGDGDCNDGAPAIYPDAPEACDGVDNNCDGLVDDGCDDDKDGYCNISKTIIGKPAICLKGTGDCNDANPLVFPGGLEVCDGQDNDCDGPKDGDDPDLAKETALCEVQLGVCAGAKKPPYMCVGGKWQACTFALYKAHPAWEAVESLCDGFDNDCNGLTDEGCDDDKDGYCDATMKVTEPAAVCPKGGGDCDDLSGAKYPGALEICNDQDDDCDGATDAGCDDDKDGYCDALLTTVGTPVTCPKGGGDCDDLNGTRNPGAAELCNGVDDDCDALLDAGDATDLLKSDAQPCDEQAGVCAGAAKPAALCVLGKWMPCSDQEYALVSPSYEASEATCDDLDNDCDGVTDAGCDVDGDGYCAAGKNVVGSPGSCAKGGGDCGEGNPAVNPGAAEKCGNGVDDNCNGKTDESGSGGGVLESFDSGGVVSWSLGTGWSIAGWCAAAGAKGLCYGNGGSGYPGVGQYFASAPMSVPPAGGKLSFNYRYSPDGGEYGSYDEFGVSLGGQTIVLRTAGDGQPKGSWQTVNWTIPQSLWGKTQTFQAYFFTKDGVLNAGWGAGIDDVSLGCN